MRIVAQRVSSASVEIDGNVTGAIGIGLLVLLGVTHEDGIAQAEWAADKICNLRIFADEEGKMNRSLLDIDGEVLLVSQFTLYGDARKGRRPSFVHAAQGDEAKALYEAAIAAVEARGVRCAGGVFGADMKVSLINDGPVTIMLDSSKSF
ncbi:MAG: D-aminoacyl-tRNA deacylase [Actinomycetota bacterium]|nr:D-aminoacyl-tRNA deacylase [Actinomycetota bacterium]